MDKTENKKTEAIRVERFYPHSRSKVWRALTEPKLLARWWAAGNIAPTVGHDFTLDMGNWGMVPCKVLEVEPEKKLLFSFNKWTISWRLEEEDNGTRLYLEQHGLDPTNPQDRNAIENMGPGWRDVVLPRLGELLDNGESRS